MCESCERARLDREFCETSAREIEAAERAFWDRVPTWDEGVSATATLIHLVAALADYARTRTLPDVADDIKGMVSSAFDYGKGK